MFGNDPTDLVLREEERGTPSTRSHALFSPTLYIVNPRLSAQLRFNYPWKELWATMFKLMRFISTPEYFEKPETLVLAAEVLNPLFNYYCYCYPLLPIIVIHYYLFIVFIDPRVVAWCRSRLYLICSSPTETSSCLNPRTTTTSTTSSFETPRPSKPSTTTVCRRTRTRTTAHTTARGVSAHTASFLFAVDRYDRAGTAQNLENMNTIIRHFTSKIDQWEAANAQNFISTPAQVTSLHIHVPCICVSFAVSCRVCVRALCIDCRSRSLQVMELIRTNYETLKLTLQDDLDSYDAYLENPREVHHHRPTRHDTARAQFRRTEAERLFSRRVASLVAGAVLPSVDQDDRGGLQERGRPLLHATTTRGDPVRRLQRQRRRRDDAQAGQGQGETQVSQRAEDNQRRRRREEE